MVILNFAHPLTAEQRAAVEQRAAARIERVIERQAQFDPARPFSGQARELAESVGLTPAEWQGTPLLINPPSLAPIACTLLAEIHGRCGYFPPIVRMRPVDGSLPPRFEVGEIIDLQGAREAARGRR